MYKKIILAFLSLTILLGPFVSSQNTVLAAEEKMAITSKMYGSSFEGNVTFDIQTCTKGYTKLAKEVKQAKIDDYKFEDSDGASGLAGKLMNMINEVIFGLGAVISNVLFGSACVLGIAPSQLLQLMFFPVVIDDFGFLDSIATTVQTISILTLVVIVALSIFELKKNTNDFGEEIISKIGMFMLAAGIIAFSKYILQGIYDIANILGYFVSNFKIDIVFQNGKDPIELAVNLLNLPTVFVTYLEFAFSPDALAVLPNLNLMMVGVMTVVKIIVMIFMTKDLLKIAMYGLKRLITLVSATVLVPVLAALIPSYKTKDIFTNYFRGVIASAFAPVLFGLIYLASAPFVIEDLVTVIEAPFLRVMVLAFYLNILASIPDFVDGLIGSSNGMGNQRFERGVNHSKMGSMGSFQKEFHGVNRTAQTLKQGGQSRTPGRVIGNYTKSKGSSFVYGKKK